MSDSVDDIITNAWMWFRDGAVWSAHLLNDAHHSNRLVHVSEVELQTRHPLLPVLLQALSEHNAATSAPPQAVVFGDCIRATLLDWTTPRSMLDDHGQTHRFLYLTSIRDVPALEIVYVWLREYFPISAASLQSATARIAFSADVTCVTTCSTNGIICPRSWFDTTYPGWSRRWLVASTLGYTDYTLTDYVLQSSTDDGTSGILPDAL